MNRLIILLLLTLAIGVSAGFAQTKGDDHAVGAWVEDRELEKDIFIRDKPSGFGKMLGEIPP